jgi:competence protein ComEC
MKARCLLLACCYFAGCYACYADTRIRLLDVGEGQAVLLSNGQDGVLIDTGHAGQAAKLLEKLSAYGVRRLAFVVLTHLHPDHASGLFRLREAFPRVPVLTSCQPLPADVTPDMTRWVYEYLQGDAYHECVRAGDLRRFADFSLRVLWPSGFENHQLNHHSLVLHLHNERKNILLMGDAGTAAEKQLLQQQVLPRVHTLVVGHHGAADASSEGLLSHIRPKQAVISVNRANIRGYPHPHVLQRLKARGIPLRRTDRHGDIEL